MFDRKKMLNGIKCLAVVSLLILMVAQLGEVNSVSQIALNIYATTRNSAPDGRVVEIDLNLLGVRTIRSGFDQARGITCAPDGTLFVAEPSKNRVLHVNPKDGSMRTVVQGNLPGLPTSFAPYYAVAAPNGDLLIPTRTWGSTQMAGLWRLRANIQTSTGFAPNQPEQIVPESAFTSIVPGATYLLRPVFLTKGPYAGDLLLIDALEPAGVTSAIVRLPAPNYDSVHVFIPTGDQGMGSLGMAIDPNGDLIVGDFNNSRLLKYSPDGSFLGVIYESIPGANQIDIDSSGTMYVTRTGGDGSLRIIPPTGSIRVITASEFWGVTVCEPRPAIADKPQVSITLGSSNDEQGLFLDSGDDMDTEVVQVGNPAVEARRTGNGTPIGTSNDNPDYYMQFRVDDEFFLEGNPSGNIRVTIEYWDAGMDKFRLQYDATGSGGPFGDGRFTDGNLISKTNSLQFKTISIVLTNAYFGNRDKGADFRIDDYGDGAETIRKVTVTLE